jgi:Flp pilus assembly protein TadD
MNAAADASSDLQFVYPGTAYIDHSGNAFDYPLDKSGRTISRYGENLLGSHKSYHVLGTHTDFFGGYYTEKDFGVIHWSRYEEKPGKKIWMWSQARDGEIWTELLTDPELGNGQYVEIQSGLLLNQAGAPSTRTPFKHQFLESHSQERFSEAWFPVLGTGGVVEANLHGSLNLQKSANSVTLSFCPVRNIDEELLVRAGGEEVFREKLLLRPMETFRGTFSAPENSHLVVSLGKSLLVYEEAQNKDLQRPLTIPADFDWNSPNGLYLQGLERARQRDFAGALEYMLRCLDLAPFKVRALVGAAEGHYRRMEYAEALEYVKRALAMDAYDPESNFTYGLICRRLSFIFDARDAFGKAARSPGFQSAANTELAEIALLERRWDDAEYSARLALNQNRFDMRARRALAIITRITRREDQAKAQLEEILTLDPLDHFSRFEQYLHSPTEEAQGEFTLAIRSELPHETFLELAIDYANLGLTEEAALVLEMAPSHPIVDYWKAYLAARVGEKEKGDKDLAAALQASPALVFPFRAETVRVLEWAESQSPHWKNKYYLGLLAWSRNVQKEAYRYFSECGDQPDFAPFYVCRGQLAKTQSPEDEERNYQKALDVGRNEWRTYRLLGSFHNERGEFEKALRVLDGGARRFGSSYVMLFDYAQTLLYNRRYDESLAILDTLTVLPFEGARYGRQTYRETCDLYALQKIKDSDYAGALDLVAKARLWPERLGVGKPFEVDERVEDYLEAYCRRKLGQQEVEKTLLESVVTYSRANAGKRGAASALTAEALRRLGKKGEADVLLRRWKAEEPRSLLQQWVSAVYEGDMERANAIVDAARNRPGGSPLTIFPTDPDALLVREIVQTIATL